jgi:hypothetical protein
MTTKPTKADNIIKYLTALAIIGAFLQVVYSITHSTVPEGNRELFSHLVGIIEGSFIGGLVAYYYTKSADTKTPKDDGEV